MKQTNERLCALAQKGDAAALDSLIDNNKSFIGKVANDLFRSMNLAQVGLNLDTDDLKQAGNLGLWKAVPKFDAARGMKFLTYAAPAIRNAMMDMVRDAFAAFEQRMVTEDKDGICYQRVSLDDVLPGEEQLRRIEAIADPYAMQPQSIMEEQESRRELYDGLKRLTQREQTYLLYRYGFTDGEEHPLIGTAIYFHLTKGRAKKTEEQAMDNHATTKVEATSLKDTKMIVDVNFLKGSSKEKVMNIKATAPTNDTKITVDFSPAVDPNGDGVKENVRMATLYITSDAMGIITDNETISDEVQEVTVSTNASGLYVKNGKGKTTYKSNNTGVAKVSSTGVVTGVKKGIAVITVTNNRVSRTFKVTVKNPSLNRTTLNLKAKKNYTLKVQGKIGKVTFKSSNTKVATVNAKGKVVAKKKGNATITVKANGITLKCKVKVK